MALGQPVSDRGTHNIGRVYTERLEEVFGDLLDAVVLQNVDDAHVDDELLACFVRRRYAATRPERKPDMLLKTDVC